MPKFVKIPLRNRFWEKVDVVDAPDVCWEWLGTKDTKGYGQLISADRNSARLLLAHRVSYELEYGKHSAKRAVVMHSCDNPGCVRPTHLRIGTQIDNVEDSVVKMRHAFGEKNGRAKLTDLDVADIRALVVGGERQTDVAYLYGVVPSTVSRIMRAERWRH